MPPEDPPPPVQGSNATPPASTSAQGSIADLPPARSYCLHLVHEFHRLNRKQKLLGPLPRWIPETIDADALEQSPRLQAALAEVTSYTPSKWLLEREMSVRDSRTPGAGKSWPPRGNIEGLGVSTGRVASNDPEDPSFRDVYVAARDEKLAGLCFSGGGIRSATFCLGVLQGLAMHGKLRAFDYLSSVSGGGYIHQWFDSWICNEKAFEALPGSLASVQQKLVPLPEKGSFAQVPQQINWLRRYSSYLTPQRGIFSADTWTMICIWLRNTSLNQIVLFSFLGSCVIAMRAATYPFVGDHAMHVLGGPSRTLLNWLDAAASDGAHWWSASHWLARGLSFGRWVAAACSAAYHSRHLRKDLWHLLDLWSMASAVSLFMALRSLRDALPRQEVGTGAGGGDVAAGQAAAVGAQPSARPMRAVPVGALGNPGVCAWIVAPQFLVAYVMALNASGKAATGYWPHTSTLILHWSVYLFLLLMAIALGSLVNVPPATAGARPEGVRKRLVAWMKQQLGFRGIVRLVAFSISAALFAVVFGALTSLLSQGSQSSPKDPVQRVSDATGGFVRHHLAPSDTFALKENVSAGGDTISTLNVEVSRKAALESREPFPSGVPIAIFGPALFWFLLFVAFRLQVGIVGREMAESRREWLARLGAWAGMAGLAWVLLCLLVHLGPTLFFWFLTKSTMKKISGVLGVLLIHAATLYSGGSGKTAGKPEPGALFGYKPLDLVGMIGAPICIVLLLMIVAGVVEWIFILGGSLVAALVSIFVVFTFLLFGWRVDVNDFSLHGFYRNRLARCYLGATNLERMPDPFTGFDDHTEANVHTGMALSDLVPKKFGGTGVFDGPFPIFCSTLTLTFGEDLAYQERKATSFAFTPLFSGYHVGWTGEAAGDRGRLWKRMRDGVFGGRKDIPNTSFNGFVPTPDYAYGDGGVSLSTVAAISGAALSPNQGFSSQPALSFLMTLFNVRLGWWIANPRKPKIWPHNDKHDKGSPWFGLRYLLGELFGVADDTSKYVCLSDGGRFDNMGMYELVRRRCTTIVICDAEQDENTTFEGIGMSIAKCRTDFGVEISLDLAKLRPRGKQTRSRAHFIEGDITYPPPPDAAVEDVYTGKIIYIKTAVVGDEPGDILHYKREHPDFPQQSTLNQWFTESQFESYRRLGQLSLECAHSGSPVLQAL